MIPMIRMLGFLLIILTMVYIVVSVWSRNVRRRKLEERWDKKDILTVDRDAFVQRGLEKYDRSFRRKLILLVYILPLGAIAVMVYVSNFM